MADIRLGLDAGPAPGHWNEELRTLVSKGWLEVANRNDPDTRFLIPPEALWTNRPRCFEVGEAIRLQALLEIPPA